MDAKAAAPKRSAGGRITYHAFSYGPAGQPKSNRTFKPAHVQFHYVYILQSELSPGHGYTSLTDDLKASLHKHNNGVVVHTSKFRPWQIKNAIASTNRGRAGLFEPI